MSAVTREQLEAYLEETLGEAETARVEQALRQSEVLQKQLRRLMQEADRGEHSLGAIWRRGRLTCPSREQLGSYLLQVLEPDFQDYVAFHLQTVACPYCLANLADLEALQQETASRVHERRRRFFESSAGLLHKG